MAKLLVPFCELWDWARPWLACGVCGYYKEDGERRGRCFVCVTINDATCQIGLRKHPAEAGYDGTKITGCLVNGINGMLRLALNLKRKFGWGLRSF